MDKDRNGKLDFNEFVEMCKHGILKSDIMVENVKQLFRLFDENNDGQIYFFLLNF